jgi:hypothetical protein
VACNDHAERPRGASALHKQCAHTALPDLVLAERIRGSATEYGHLFG